MKRPDGIEVKQFALRWSNDLRKQIVDAAETNKRSVNAELLVTLERGLARHSAEDRGAAA